MVVGKNFFFQICFFISGLSAGMTCIGLYSNNGGITLFTLIQFILVLAGIFFKRPRIAIERIKSPFFGLIVCIFISPFINLFFLSDVWRIKSFTNLMSNILGLTSFYLLYSRDEIATYKQYFIKGFKINFIIQMIWSYAQFLFGHVFNISLNYAVGLYMPKILPVREISGLTWERAELSLVIIVGFILFKDNFLIRCLAVGCLILTESRTAFIMSVVLVFLSLDYRKIWSYLVEKKGIKNVLIIMLAITLIFFNRDLLWEFVKNTVINIKQFKRTGSGYAHFLYYSNLGYIFSKISFINILFGFSDGCSGYPYALYLGRSMSYAWTVESTILSFLFSYGVIGFSFWLVWMIKKICLCKKRGEKNMAVLFETVIIGGFFYAILSNWGLTILIILSEYSYHNQKSTLPER